MEEYIFSLFGDMFSDGGLIESSIDDVFDGVDMNESYFTSDSIYSSQSTNCIDSCSLVPNNVANSISFGRGISDLYDWEIDTHLDNAMNHVSNAIYTQDSNMEKFHWQEAGKEIELIKAWQDCKSDALIASQKDSLFLDATIDFWNRTEQWQQEYEDICLK